MSATGEIEVISDNGQAEKVCVSDLDLYDMRVLMRVDYNCPLDADSKISDDTRIRETLPTLKLLKDKGAKCIVLVSHLGRPKGREEKLTLYPVALCLSKLMNEQITFIDDTIGSCVEKAINAASGGRIILVENVRFYEQEENMDDPVPETVLEFRESLARLADVYVNDAFGCAHRAHSSVVGVNMATRAAGLLMKKELDVFSKVLVSPDQPFLAILGGAKVHDKIKLIENLLDKVNVLIIGGGMAFTFLKVLFEMEIGQSLYDEEGIEDVKAIAEKADQKEVKISLPLDFTIANKMDPDAETNTCTREDGIPNDWIGMDIGEKTIEAYKEIIAQANTIIWNGPMGVFEWDKFEAGTKALLEAVADRTAAGATTVLGGGDTASAATKWDLGNRVTHVSTGGGATLELLEGKILPGVAALTDKSEFESTKQQEPTQGSIKVDDKTQDDKAQDDKAQDDVIEENTQEDVIDENAQEDVIDEKTDSRLSKVVEPASGSVRTSQLQGGSLIDRKSLRSSALKKDPEAIQRVSTVKDSQRLTTEKKQNESIAPVDTPKEEVEKDLSVAARTSAQPANRASAAKEELTNREGTISEKRASRQSQRKTEPSNE